MAFTISPGVVTRELELTAGVQESGTTAGGFAGAFQWGPVDKITTVSSEDELVKKFQKPDSDTYTSFFTAANFLAYGQNLKVVRVANTSAKNASTSGGGILIKNRDAYEATYDPDHGGTADGTYGTFVAKYPGSIGNSLKVSLCGADKAAITLTGTVSGNTSVVTGTGTSFESEVSIGDVILANENKFLVTAVTNNTQLSVATEANANASTDAAQRLIRSAFSEPANNMLGTVTASANSVLVTGSDTYFSVQLNVGDILSIGGQKVSVNSITSNTSLTLVSPITNAVSANTFSRKWEYNNVFDYAPSTTVFAANKGASQDELHVVVIDEDGVITNVPGAVLETYPAVSVASDAKSEDGTSLYYKKAVNNRSDYVWFMDHPSAGDANTTLGTVAWGTATASSAYTANAFVMTSSLTNGNAGSSNITDAQKIAGFDLLKNPEEIDVSLIPTGSASATVVTHVINNIAEFRKDCMVFCSPEFSDVVNNIGDETVDVVNFRNRIPSSSYAVLDSGYKYQYDKYNDVYRYVPLNGDTAGLVVRTAYERDFFFSPAGSARGQIKNVTKLPYNPNKTDRDELYKNGVNPVVSFPGQGTILFGDKTLLAKPSAFDRINVRRLFITLEKSISQFAQGSMFEFNDAFTRSRFVSSVEPYLRDIQGRGGITDFAVICDETNNTPEVVERNEFVGSIFVKPVRSINFILLNFVAVRSGVEFEEIVNVV